MASACSANFFQAAAKFFHLHARHPEPAAREGDDHDAAISALIADSNFVIINLDLHIALPFPSRRDVSWRHRASRRDPPQPIVD
jgi:hypothetical protein